MDWTGNSNSIYTTLGASNHTDKERETNDYLSGSGCETNSRLKTLPPMLRR